MEYPTDSLRAAVGPLLEALEFVTKQITVQDREVVAL